MKLNIFCCFFANVEQTEEELKETIQTSFDSKQDKVSLKQFLDEETKEIQEKNQLQGAKTK